MTHLGRALRAIAVELTHGRPSPARRRELERINDRLWGRIMAADRQREAKHLGYLDLGGEG